MSSFQDELRRLEQASDQIELQEAEQQATVARNRAQQLVAAQALRETIDACITEAKNAVPSLRTEHTPSNQSNVEWTLLWKDGDRGLKIQLRQDEGVVWWTWMGHGRSSAIAKRSATDADELFIQRLIAALADPTPWQRGGYPPEPTW
jgi:hypothetical protein